MEEEWKEERHRFHHYLHHNVQLHEDHLCAVVLTKNSQKRDCVYSGYCTSFTSSLVHWSHHGKGEPHTQTPIHSCTC